VDSRIRQIARFFSSLVSMMGGWLGSCISEMHPVVLKARGARQR
jgi:hypothetical protein